MAPGRFDENQMKSIVGYDLFFAGLDFNLYSPGYLLIYPPQIATVMKPISFCSKYNPVSHTKSLGESREWNMVFQGSI